MADDDVVAQDALDLRPECGHVWGTVYHLLGDAGQFCDEVRELLVRIDERGPLVKDLPVAKGDGGNLDDGVYARVESGRFEVNGDVVVAIDLGWAALRGPLPDYSTSSPPGGGTTGLKMRRSLT